MGSKPVGISGSRAAAIIGLSQYSTPFTVWQEIMEKRQPGFNAKRGYIYEPFEGNASTEFGLAFEDAVCELTETDIGHQITNREGSYKLPEIEYVTCHIDGQINGKLFEGKTVNHRAFGAAWGEPGTDRIPQVYAVQIQHNLMLTGFKEATMSALVFPSTVQEWEEQGWQAHHNNINGVYFLKNHETDQIVMPSEWAEVFAQIGNFHSYHIEAKPDTHKILKELYAEFWQRHVVEEIPPDSVDYSDARRIFSEPKGTLVIGANDKIGGESVADIMREFRDITKEIGSSGHLAKRKQFIKNQVLKFAMDKTTVADDESVEKIVFRDESGNKLGSWNGKTYRS